MKSLLLVCLILAVFLVTACPPVVQGPPATVIALAAGYYHALALKSNGAVLAWGRNSSGQLGDGTYTDRMTPAVVQGLGKIVALVSGYNFSLALASDGSVWAWGYNYNGQLGDGTTTNRSLPVQVPGLSGVTAVSAGSSHTLALKSDGTVVGWGGNWSGQLGDGSYAQRLTPVTAYNLSSVIAISAGSDDSIALMGDGQQFMGPAWRWHKHLEHNTEAGARPCRHLRNRLGRESQYCSPDRRLCVGLGVQRVWPIGERDDLEQQCPPACQRGAPGGSCRGRPVRHLRCRH